MIILYASHADIIDHWTESLKAEEIRICHHEKELLSFLKSLHVKVVLLLDERCYGDEIEGFLDLLQSEYAHVHIMLFSQKPTFVQGSLLLKYGIRAYGNTYMDPLHLEEALAVVRHGDTWLYPEFIQTMIQTLMTQKTSLHVKHHLLEKLSLKERDVALLIKEGMSNKEIAMRVGTTERTVKAHLSSIYEKIGVKDRLALAILL
ncbi:MULTISPECIES: response regulator transcription factor [unclassified Sulfurospirillum]|uniref:response regulator transcription factor n=1 Tax=unclassified Sulfurospirillum TaxID=2618290 RepID=UPI00068F025C|nr:MULTISPECIES: response regulator transcription factor [unclassified Sulfurospirillum]